MPRKRSLRLNPADDKVLSQLYLRRLIATDRYPQAPAASRWLVRTFNAMTGRQDTIEELLHYMRTRRKNKLWPRLEGRHQRLPLVLGDRIDPLYIPVLQDLYVEFGIGADNVAHDPALARRLSRAFEELTGERLPGMTIAVAWTELRKRGQLPTLEDDEGFDDFGPAEERDTGS